MRYFFLISICCCIGHTQLEAQKVTVIGVGRLGLCFALCLERAGFEVLGVDLSPEYILRLNQKTLISPEPEVNELLRQSSHFQATTSLDEGLQFSDLLFIAVQTNPLTAAGQYNCEILDNLLIQIDERKVMDKHIVIVSTLFPGYIREVAVQKLSHCPNVAVSYNPEFIAQGQIVKGLLHPDVVLIGESNPERGMELETIYRKLCQNDPFFARMSPESAEIMKLGLNCFVTMKIAFANLIGDIADATPSADKDKILQAIGMDSRIGSKCLKPGYGFGGPCFPRDNRALGDYAHLVGIEPTLFRATDQTNLLHAEYLAQQLLAEGLDTYRFEDVCYKSNCPVPIIEESHKLLVAKKISDAGKTVIIQDRAEVIQQVRSQYGEAFQYTEN